MIQSWTSYCRFQRHISWPRILPLALAISLFGSATGLAQVRRVYPPDDFFRAFRPYLDGDYITAQRYFARASGRKIAGAESVDSIPAHTMVGECWYHMGNLRKALDQYNIALRLFLKSPAWINRMEMPAALTATQRGLRLPPTWGTSTRPIRVAKIPDPMPALEGQTPAQNMGALQRGGVLAGQQYILVHAKEIVRCTALALRRRAEILGPAAKYDDFTNQLISAFESRPAPNRHWTQAWISCQLGLAYIAAGKPADAKAELNKSLLVGGMDHMLTPTALLELGKLAIQEKQYAAAEQLFLEATYSAAYLVQQDSGMYDYDVIGEAFRWGMVAHRAAGNPAPFPPLIPAAAWSHRESSALETSILITAAADLAARRDGKRAGAILEQAGRLLRRREMARGTLGARHQYAVAHTSFLRGDGVAGTAALGSALQFARTGALWTTQIALADALFRSGQIETHRASKLFASVLRDPTAEDWLLDPMESLAALTYPNLVAYEDWLQIVIDRKEFDDALRISDQLRRRRFYSTLPLGGRLLNLRWIVAAPATAMPDSAMAFRQSLLVHHPPLADLAQRAAAVRAQLATLPPTLSEPDQYKQQATWLEQLGQIGTAQESLLSAIALGPEPTVAVFPPATDVEKIQQQLAPGQRIMSFITIPSGTYAFMLDRAQYQPWQLKSPAKIKANIAKLLRDMGLYERSQLLTTETLAQTNWQDTSAELLNQLTGNAAPDVWNTFEELVIVPEGPLWYVPFAALQVGEGEQREPLINKVRIRYAPTLSLAVPDRQPRKRFANTAIVAGRLFSKGDTVLTQKMLADMKADDPNVFAVPIDPVPPSSLYTTTLDRLVVMNDIPVETAGPYAWAPMALDRGKATGRLAQWMQLPWGGPDQIILPGFHSAAENGLKKGGTGDEIFLAACGLMATGCRTVVLSRWPEGGAATSYMIREFIRELPNRSASSAWQRAVHLTMANDLVFAEEPRIEPPQDDTAFKTEHPFFWAGCILIDRGVEPKK